MGIAILKAALTRSFLTLLANLLTNFFGTLEATHGRRYSEAILTLSHLALLTDEFRKAFFCLMLDDEGPHRKNTCELFWGFPKTALLGARR